MPRAPEIIRRLQPKIAQVEGISLYMQPIQDLTRGEPRQPHAVSVLDGSPPTQAELNTVVAAIAREDSGHRRICATSLPISRTAGWGCGSTSIAIQRRGSASRRR